jgi:hypothetical protein
MAVDFGYSPERGAIERHSWHERCATGRESDSSARKVMIIDPEI